MDLMQLVYISNSVFPTGAAYATRMSSFSKLFAELGWKTHIIVDHTNDKALLKDKCVSYGNVTFQALHTDFSLRTRLISPRLCLKALESFMAHNEVSLVVMNGCADRFELVARFLKKRGVPLVLDVVEWYHYSNFSGGWMNPFYLQHIVSMTKRFTKADGIIAISRLIEQHFSKYVTNVVRIPSIFDVINTPYNETTANQRIRLMYAGNPGRSKEPLSNVLLALYALEKEERNRFLLSIFGVSKDQIEENLGEVKHLLAELSDCVTIEGKVPHNTVLEEYRRSDFSVFLRPQRRSSHAGFPTKLAESMMSGTPVITNDTGDIGLYLNDNENGFLLKDNGPESLKETLKTIIDMDPEHYRLYMRQMARKTAENCFDYRIYIAQIEKLFQSVVDNHS